MIDTMFFLLVFFMITTLSMTIQRGMPVKLPGAQSVSEKAHERVSISLTEDGKLFFNKELTTLRNLRAHLEVLRRTDPHPAILINADKRVQHGRVIAVMDLVRLSGIARIGIATRPKSERSL